MPLLRFRIAVLTVLCAFVTCALPCAAAAIPPAEDPEEYPLPTRLPPMRERQTPPAVLQRSVLEAVAKVEESARLEAEAEARLEGEQRAREEHALGLKEQQEARESARITRELRQARAKLLADTLKMAAPPPAAVVPAKKDWPLPKLVEDPAWNTPATAFFYQNNYDQADIRTFYRQLLIEAVNGNPRAMIVLAYAYKRWGSEISSSFSTVSPPMHSSDYWRRWALQLTSPDWVDLRWGDVSPDLAEKLSRYRAAAAYRNSEAMYNIAIMDDRPELLVEAALAGHPGAASIVAFNMGMGTEGFPASPRQASAYWWRGALAGDVRSMLVCSEFFFQGQNGFPKDDRRAYMLALLAAQEAQSRESAASGLLPTARRHLVGLDAALGLNADAVWERKQELEIFRAAPEEERLSRLNAAAPARETVLYDLESELATVRAALDAGESVPGGQRLPLRVSSMDAGNTGLDAPLADGQRWLDNYYFLWFGVFGALVVLCGYLGMRLHFYSRVVRLVSVKEGGQA